jgi:2-methylcitrate dehydratase PrpD
MLKDTVASVNGRLGAFAAGLALDDVPEAVVERAKDCLIHGLVVAHAGIGVGFAELAEEALGASSGNAHVLASGATAAAPLAAFANGALLHARAQEDTHGTFHPGVATIPAALAVAEAEGADGGTLLAAVIAGYEVGTAVSAALTERSTPPFRATGVYGPLAAAAAAGRVMGLDERRMGHALALAAAFAGGSSEAFAAGTDEWHFQSGMAAAAGVLAAGLARAGAQGSPHAFDGRAGYLDCFARGGDGADAIGAELGRRWGILEVTFKPFPVCAFNQTPALLAAGLAHEGEVRSLVLRMNEREATYPGMPYAGPFESVAQTLMSTRFCVAVALAEGHIAFADLQRYDDPVLLDLIERIEVVPEPDRAAKTAAATLTLADGRVVERAIEDSQPRLSWDGRAVRENARRLRPETRLSEAGLEALIAAVETLDLGGSVATLVDTSGQ